GQTVTGGHFADSCDSQRAGIRIEEEETFAWINSYSSRVSIEVDPTRTVIEETCVVVVSKFLDLGVCRNVWQHGTQLVVRRRFQLIGHQGKPWPHGQVDVAHDVDGVNRLSHRGRSAG